MTDQLPQPQGDNLGSFESLVTSIQSASEQLAARASKAVNVSLTVRNWLIGYYIARYELNGADRAAYGEQLLPKLAARLKDLGVPTWTKRSLYKYLRFYQVYPAILGSLTPKFKNLLPTDLEDGETAIVQSPTAQFIESLSYAGMPSALFVSKYQLELPSKEVLQAQIAAERERLEGQQ